MPAKNTLAVMLEASRASRARSPARVFRTTSTSRPRQIVELEKIIGARSPGVRDRRAARARPEPTGDSWLRSLGGR